MHYLLLAKAHGAEQAVIDAIEIHLIETSHWQEHNKVKMPDITSEYRNVPPRKILSEDRELWYASSYDIQVAWDGYVQSWIEDLCKMVEGEAPSQLFDHNNPPVTFTEFRKQFNDLT